MRPSTDHTSRHTIGSDRSHAQPLAVFVALPTFDHTIASWNDTPNDVD